MKVFKLKRVAVLDAGAFGVLLDVDIPFAVTCERTYESAQPKIPSGTYRCSRTIFYRGGYPTYEIHVPGHSRLLFHRGNVETDSEGCVLVANSFGDIKGVPAVLGSAVGFAEFMERTKGESEFELVVE